jgi:DNA-binding transcriptional MerR regulator
MWKPQHLVLLYGIVLETARQWAIEFQDYLSKSGKPGKNKHRLFSDEDMQVFSLVAEMKQQGRTNEDIHAALKAGQRGDVPLMPPEQLTAMATTDRERSLALQLTYMQQELIKAQEELGKVQQVKEELAREREAKLQIQARYEEVKRTEQELRTQVMELTKQLGREFNEGYKLGLKDAQSDE